MTGIDPNIILVNVLATIGVVKAILWLLDTGEESSLGERRNYKDKNNKVKPLRMSKRILGMLHDEDDEEDENKKDKTEKEEDKRPVPRWIRIIQEEEMGAKEKELPAEELPGARRARKATETDEESIEIYLYAICICVSIILSIIILR